MTPAEVAAERRKIVHGVIDMSRRGGQTDGGFNAAFSRCESPIEQAYCLTLFQVPGVSAIDGDFEPAALRHMNASMSRIFVFAQQPIPPYRADFMLLGISPREAEPRFVIVECDGSDYHSGREQMRRDAHRQSCLEATGFKVIRFDGGMIYREPQTIVRRSLEPFAGFDAPARARGVDGGMLRKAFWELKRWSGT